MGMSSYTGPTVVGRNHGDVGERFVAFLRSRHPSKTAINVAADTGCPIDQVEKWIERLSLPNGRGMLALISAYGPEFLVAVMPGRPDWLDGAHREARRCALEAEISARQTELDVLRSAL